MACRVAKASALMYTPSPCGCIATRARAAGSDGAVTRHTETVTCPPHSSTMQWPNHAAAIPGRDAATASFLTTSREVYALEGAWMFIFMDCPGYTAPDCLPWGKPAFNATQVHADCFYTHHLTHPTPVPRARAHTPCSTLPAPTNRVMAFEAGAVEVGFKAHYGQQDIVVLLVCLWQMWPDSLRRISCHLRLFQHH